MNENSRQSPFEFFVLLLANVEGAVVELPQVHSFFRFESLTFGENTWSQNLKDSLFGCASPIIRSSTILQI